MNPGEVMRLIRVLMGLAALVIGSSVFGQSPLAGLSGSTYRERVVYAVYDLQGTEVRPERVEEIVLGAIRLYARDAQVRQGVPLSLVPDYPNQMTVGRRANGGPKPECVGEVFSVEGIDSSMAKYGEGTYHRVCLFPYAGGFRLNYFAIYGQKQGVGGANPNVLSGMFGRLIGKTVGLSDSSAFINKVMDQFEAGFKDAGLDFRLVELFPQRQGDRIAVEDNLSRPVMGESVEKSPDLVSSVASSLPQGPSHASSAFTGQQGGSGNLPPELLQLQAAFAKQQVVARQQSARIHPATPLPTQGGSFSALEARKELRSMGLEYFSQEQFVAAIERGDVLAVSLFIAGNGVDIHAGEVGSRPLDVAERMGNQEIVALIRAKEAP